MYELCKTIIVAVFFWGYPIYNLVKNKKMIDINECMLMPIGYFVFLLGADRFGDINKLIFYYMILHVIVFIFFYTYSAMMLNDDTSKNTVSDENLKTNMKSIMIGFLISILMILFIFFIIL